MAGCAFAVVGGGGGVMRKAYVVLLATIALLQCWTDAMVINGTEMTMDQAIMAAAGSSKIFRLMEDANVVRVEMDMLFKTDVWESMMRERENSTKRHRRKVIRDQRFRWANLVIPYQIAASWSDRDYQQFQEALSDYHRYTCLRFRQATPTDRDYLRIVDGGGCSSYVGRQGGEQTVSLASGCRHKGIIIHELGHAVGFQHEQTRPDRDSFVYVAQENIDSNMYFNFQKYTAAEVDTVSVPYDYLSVMHYGEYAFTRNGQRTILTRDPAYQSRIGNRAGFSFRDVKLVNAIYACAERNKCPARQCPGEGFVGTDCTCWCPSRDEVRPVMQCSDQQATTARPATASPCADGNNACAQWARQGYCSNAQHREYMSINCKSSCNLCSAQTTTTARPSTVSPCADDNYACPQWAQVGYCSSGQYREYMSIHCNASCNLCSVAPAKVTMPVTKAPATQPRTVGRQTQPSTARPPQTRLPSTASSRRATVVGATTARLRPCHDANDMCSAWAHHGECDANPRYMLTHCAASCGSCDSATVAAACRDLEVHCDNWSGRGYCGSQHYAAYMQNHCPRACGVCSAAVTATTAAARTAPRVAVGTATFKAAAATTTTAPQRGYAMAATTRGAGGPRQPPRKVAESPLRSYMLGAAGEERPLLASETAYGVGGGDDIVVAPASEVGGGAREHRPKGQRAEGPTARPKQQHQPRRVNGHVQEPSLRG